MGKQAERATSAEWQAFKRGEGHLSTEASPTLNRRILRDMSDGIMAIDGSGHIIFANAAAEQVLGRSFEQMADQPFAAIFFADSHNDDFNQLILNAMYDKHAVHRGRVDYVPPESPAAAALPTAQAAPLAASSSLKRTLDLAVSFVYDDDGSAEGVVVLIEDVTSLVRVEREKREGIQLFSYGLFCVVAAFLFIWQILSAFMVVPNWVMARVMELLTLGLAVFALTRTSMTVKDVGLTAPPRQLRTTLLRGVAIGAGIVGLLAVVRLAANQLVPGAADIPFFDWHLEIPTQLTYFFVAPFQEFLAKGIVLTAMLHIFSNAKSKAPVILGSSVLFASMHVNYGLAMMLLAFLLCFATGWLYLKDRNIWGCAIIHFCLGFFATCFGLEQLFT
jgi:membrane protease YdiL (CAAX protease family)